MPALDQCHFQVVHALEKDGWTVNPKPRHIRDSVSRKTAIFIDIEAIQTDANNVDHPPRIFVEVKCFTRSSTTRELYATIGQYIVYRTILARKRIVVPLYVAIPRHIHRKLFTAVVKEAVADNYIKFIIVDIKTETVTQWIE